MKRILMTAAASLALGLPAAAAWAQDADATVAADTDGVAVTLTGEQQTMYDGWPADRRATYDAWPVEARRYYWTLTPEQTEGWWVLNDEQRVRIVGMTPEQRTAAWSSIAAQMSARGGQTATGDTDAPASASASASTTTTAEVAAPAAAIAAPSGAVQFVRREMTQPVAAAATENAAALASGDLPVCKPNQQDGCINGWEKNRRGNKPLSYWPGRPASEIPGKKPDPQ